MSYRNRTAGLNGSIEISRNEIETANKFRSKIVIAQETSEVEPAYITFFNTSKSLYDSEINLLQNRFRGEKSYGGIATHYINSVLELK